MPDIRTSDARSGGQAMTIPEIIKAELKAQGRFEVGSEIYLPDYGQTLRVARLDFSSGKKGQKGVWLRWESECVQCGKKYQFTTKRSFSYPTRTCEEHRKVGARPRSEPVGPAPEAVRSAAIAVLNGFSLLDERVLISEAVKALQVMLFGDVLPRADKRVRGLWAALADVMESGEAPGVPGDDDILFI